MADDSLPSGYLEAGRDFWEALKPLGLVPEALFWAQDKTIGEFVLVLITRSKGNLSLADSRL